MFSALTFGLFFYLLIFFFSAFDPEQEAASTATVESTSHSNGRISDTQKSVLFNGGGFDNDMYNASGGDSFTSSRLGAAMVKDSPRQPELPKNIE